MKKEIYNLKEKEMLAINSEVNISKNGNKYIYLEKYTRSLWYNIGSVTKKTINKIHTQSNIEIPSTSVLLLTPSGKFMIKTISEKNFRNLSHRDLNRFPQLKNIFYTNKKCEWLKNEEISFHYFYNLLKSFTSKKELLKFLGVTFKIENLTYPILKNLINGYKFKNKQELIKITEYELDDIIHMINSTNSQHYYNSNKSLKTIHNELIEIQNKQKIDSASITPILCKFNDLFYTKLKKVFSQENIKPLTCERDLLKEGIIQHNCVLSRINHLSDNCFFHITEDEEEYTCQLAFDKIIEIKAKYNNQPSKEFIEKINNTLYKL